LLVANTTKQKLRNGETVYGTFMRQADPTLAEFVAMQGMDFMIFDGEHGSLEARDIEGLSRACELHGVTPIARVPTNEPSTILRFLDAGAHGVQVPWVNTADEVEQVVRSAKYGPRGMRGLAGSRQGGWGITEPLGEFTQRANRETMVVIHIETAAAAGAVEQYVAIDDVDVLFIGPTDLSHSLGHPGDLGHPEVVKVMDRVTEVVVASDKTLGIFVGTRSAAESWEEKGARYIAAGFEGLIKQGIQAYLPDGRSS